MEEIGKVVKIMMIIVATLFLIVGIIFISMDSEIFIGMKYIVSSFIYLFFIKENSPRIFMNNVFIAGFIFSVIGLFNGTNIYLSTALWATGLIMIFSVMIKFLKLKNRE
ncbi:MAG: hypothetical protein JXR48_01680 [Candidatus Delongbacteria bacterium]|nr:hypothetical protein [Candidatus Delongbacteria bacterium]MBN2833654.1 hypothetical protein [Candidatus Delongbacteria bacterium]